MLTFKVDDGLPEDDNPGSLARDDLVALCDLVTQVLNFVAVDHLPGTWYPKANWQVFFTEIEIAST
ncbi:MAG: hypothetical protein Q8Q59_06830 [Luteolibacter sp.]|nr:hypothetical protein [Luteolibacter sp.]